MSDIDMAPDVSMLWHLIKSNKMADDSQLEEVLEESIRTGQSFQRVLYNYNIIDENHLLKLIADELGTQFVEIDVEQMQEDIIKAITGDQARTYGIIPVAVDEETITVVTDNPFDPRLVDELHFVLNKDCRILVGRPKEIEDAIDILYPEKGESVDDILNELSTISVIEDSKETSAFELEKSANEAPIVRFVNVILQQAIKDKASDIHFEPFANEFRIRYRIDGSLYEMAPPPKHLAVPVISRIKVMSNMNISERRIPQDGRIELRVNRKPVDLRVSTLPTRYGESVVLRILDRNAVNLDLETLGMGDKIIKGIRELVRRPNGIFVVTGPTSSGKTTTLYSALREINVIEDKLLTVEDPVEYDIEGIMQVPVHEQVGMTFANALRAFLRQDPDRIMVGEIRDTETATIATQASLTGHLVLSTLHTNDAAGAVTRLIDMGIEPFLISSTLLGALAQRLVRRVCYNCKESYTPTDEELKSLGITREQVAGRPFWRGTGCEICNGSGYKGRSGVYELLVVSDEMRNLIIQRKPTMDIKSCAVRDGMIPIRQDGITQILDGVTTVSEIIQYTMA